MIRILAFLLLLAMMTAALWSSRTPHVPPPSDCNAAQHGGMIGPVPAMGPDGKMTVACRGAK
jgi:hypothetical protein